MMFLFNGIIFLAGAAILGVGIWVKVDSGCVERVGYLLIAVGAVLVILGFLGCCGAIRKKREQVYAAAGIFIIILLVFIAECCRWSHCATRVFKPLAENLIKQVGTEVVKSIRNDYGKNPDVTGLWNTTMTSLKCCGFNNYTDFTNSYFVNDTKSYPFQCCHRVPCIEITAFNSTVPGCFPALKKLVDDNAVIIIGVALGSHALELAAMIVSMILYCKIGSKRD
ncbi:tetraspanin-1-like [Cyprinus carpio]|uniref:Tetraspanin-1 n=1 Tax=Cyprinus carpio TaxID=7962 RepID=A0A9R0A814_CYPCA|nr:tetraspanin-1-like [Cyprinus carpio]